jgi:hypothetical protein
MSKRNHSTFQDSAKMSTVREAIFTNSVGETFVLHGLPPLAIPKLAEGIKFPTKPTYTITTATGDIETHEHDATSLSSDEDKKAWAEYISKDAMADAELSSKMLTYVLVEGIVIDEIPNLDRWLKRQKLVGIEVPEDTEERILLYKQTAVIRSTDDIQNIMQTVMNLTGVSEEAIAMARSSFPDIMES